MVPSLLFSLTGRITREENQLEEKLPARYWQRFFWLLFLPLRRGSR
jgi:hypothetical protein